MVCLFVYQPRISEANRARTCKAGSISTPPKSRQPAGQWCRPRSRKRHPARPRCRPRSRKRHPARTRCRPRSRKRHPVRTRCRPRSRKRHPARTRCRPLVLSPIPSRECACAASRLRRLCRQSTTTTAWGSYGSRSASGRVLRGRRSTRIGPLQKSLRIGNSLPYRLSLPRSCCTARSMTGGGGSRPECAPPPGLLRPMIRPVILEEYCRNGLIEDLAVVESEAEAKALLGSILCGPAGPSSAGCGVWPPIAGPWRRRARNPSRRPRHGSEGDSEPAEQDQQNEPQEGEQ